MNGASSQLPGLILVLTSLFASTVASAGPRTHRYDPSWEMDQAPSGLMGLLNLLPSGLTTELLRPQVIENLFDQKLDPSNLSDTRTFQQRYFIYSAHAANADSPVVFYICGESECRTSSFVGRFTEKVAETLNAHVIALEHRYYGKSQPYVYLTTENLKYLSTDNALADLARFQHYAMSQLGFTGKWIAIGGSYPGSLAAYYRLKHPELVVGALASSAPVQAKNNFEEYDAHVAKVTGPECAAALRKVSRAGEAAHDAGEQEFSAFKAQFDAAEVRVPGDFLYLLADISADAVQYGYPEKLCSPLTKAQDPVETYAAYVRDFLRSRGQTAVEFSVEGAMNQNAESSDGMRAWYYQSCMEYGYWQDAHQDPARSTRSSRINSEYDRELCRRLFGISQLADESVMNAKYYEPLLDPSQASRILFTNGSNDPWTNLSITAERKNDTNPNTAVFMIEGKAHCSDLRSVRTDDPESLQKGRQLFLDLATNWIK